MIRSELIQKLMQCNPDLSAKDLERLVASVGGDERDDAREPPAYRPKPADDGAAHARLLASACEGGCAKRQRRSDQRRNSPLPCHRQGHGGDQRAAGLAGQSAERQHAGGGARARYRAGAQHDIVVGHLEQAEADTA